MQGQFALEEFAQRIAQRQLVLCRQFDIDALDTIAVIAHARQRDDHVFIEFEGVGVA